MGNGRRRRRRVAARIRRQLRRQPYLLARSLRVARFEVVTPQTDTSDVIRHDEPLDGEDVFVSYLLEIHREKISTTEKEAVIARGLLTKANDTIARMEREPRNLKDRKQVQELGALRTEVVRLRGRLRVLEDQLGGLNPLEPVFRYQYRAICSTPRVRKVYVHAPRLVYRTDALYGKDHEGYWHRIGPFEISFDLINPVHSSFTWRNLDGMRGGLHGPPNIFNNNEIGVGFVNCMGYEAFERMAQAREKLDYPAMVALSVRYPECKGQLTNPAIKNWPIVPVSKVPDWYIETFGA